MIISPYVFTMTVHYLDTAKWKFLCGHPTGTQDSGGSEEDVMVQVRRERLRAPNATFIPCKGCLEHPLYDLILAEL